MAFRPTEYIANFGYALKEFENYFDDKLEHQKVGAYDTYVDVPVPKGYTEAHHKELKSRYLDAGWALVVNHTEYVRFYAKH